jgi:hypothetical protein
MDNVVKVGDLEEVSLGKISCLLPQGEKYAFNSRI